MKRIVFWLVAWSAMLFGDGVWSSEQKPLQKEQAQKVLKDFEKNSSWDAIVLKEEQKPLISQTKFNLCTLSVGVGGYVGNETLSNTTGSKTVHVSGYGGSVAIGKDFAWWHNDFSQYSRLYFNYEYEHLDEVSFSTYTIGVAERMKYFSFLCYRGFVFYPVMSIGFGKAKLSQRNTTVGGFEYDGSLAVTTQYGYNYELSVAAKYAHIAWDYPIEGVEDSFAGLSMQILFTYRINYGDF